MARTRVSKLAFNRGLVSRLGTARVDIKRVAMSAEIQTNWRSRVLGSMSLRPGWGYLGSSRDDERAFHLPFVFSTTDKAIIEITDSTMRVWVDDEVVTRPAVTTAITNGTFDTDLTGWNDEDESGATSAWTSGAYLGLTGDGTAYAIRRQEVTVPFASQGVENALHIHVARGPVILRVGNTEGEDDLIAQTTLGTGYHSLAFTPVGGGINSAWVEFKSNLERIVLVKSCEIEAAGAMELEAPWVEADIGLLRARQSADVLFVACAKTTDRIGYQQRRIERRSTRSWSVVVYETEDGPFRVANTSPTTITASALDGNVTLTASAAVFKDGHAGALFQLVSVGQQVEETISAQNTFSDPIRISGVDSGRIFTIIISGLTGTTSTVNLQRSLDEPGNWEDVTTGGSPASPWTADTTRTYDDGLDNQIVYYRIGVKTGDYVAGTIVCQLNIGTGSITGVARVTSVTSELIAEAEVLTSIGSLAATDDWSEGQWSDYRGWPTSVEFHEGRLCWFGRDALQMSISDAFDGFDPDYEGDAAPLNRTIGTGPVDTINWALSLSRLLVGGQGAEFSVRSSSLDEPITPTNFNIRPVSTQGSAAVEAVKVDQNGVYVQRGGTRVMELSFSSTGIDYESTHLSALVPEIGAPGIVRGAVQRQPDTRLHFPRSDGTVALVVFDKVEQVIAWGEDETDGDVEDMFVLPGDPGDEEDWVYYSVNRTINGATKRYLEKAAFQSECLGDASLCKLADSFIEFTNSPPSATVTGLGHLEGEEVVVWADGKCMADADGEIETFTVASGQISLTHDGAAYVATTGIVGLAYEAPWKSGRLAELMEQPGSGILSMAALKGLGLILADIHPKGLKYGHNLTEADMRDLPEKLDGATIDPDAVLEEYTLEPTTFPGRFTPDSRLCLLAQAPRPCTILAAIAEVEFHG